MLRVAWPTEYRGDGNSFGYSVHNDQARKALVDAGAELSPDAPVAVHVAPAHMFRPLEGRFNVLYTAWESTDIPPFYLDGLRRADVIVVPATFLVEAVRRALPERPVYYCPLGVDVAHFEFRPRKAPRKGGRFRFLWVGAPNARKGWEIVREAWRGYARLAGSGARLPPAELYMKTTVTGRLERLGPGFAPIVFDSRRLSCEELAELYLSAHAFLFPSFGEGFGLTMAEAMATGLPVIFTPWSAMTDLADESCGYPLEYELVRLELAEGSSAVFARSSAEDLLRRMLEVMLDYSEASRRGQVAAARIRERFLWERTGRTLRSILLLESERRGI